MDVEDNREWQNPIVAFEPVWTRRACVAGLYCYVCNAHAKLVLGSHSPITSFEWLQVRVLLREAKELMRRVG